MKINNLASDLLKLFFDYLNINKIDYVILRNYEGLPKNNVSKDVDILINSYYHTEAAELLKQTAQELKYQLIWKNKLDYLYGFAFVKRVGDEIYSVKIDLFEGLKWHGCFYINQNYIFKNKIDYNGFKVPNKGHEAFIMIVYYLLYAKKIKQKYHELIYENSKTHFDEFKLIVQDNFSKINADKIIDLITNKSLDEIVTIRKDIRNEIILKNFKRKLFFKNYFRHFKCEVFDRGKMGALISFSGPDGAGKSTLVKPFIDLLHDLGLSQTNIPHHFLTKNIPSLHKLPGAPAKFAKQDYTKPYQAKPTGFINSTIRTIYYYFAFLFDRQIYINKMLKSNEIVVFDRYYLDLVADPSRIRISLNKNLVRSIFGTLPKPNFSIIVLANKEQIFKRKGELTKEKTTELIENYENLPKKFKQSVIVYNTGSVGEGETKIFKILFDHLDISSK